MEVTDRRDPALSAGGRGVRVVVTLAGLVLILAATLVGTDDDFPFAPFRMYSTTDRLDSPVHDPRMEAVDTTGARLVLTDGESGLRRAEIEGQLGRLRQDPALLDGVAVAYHARRPDRPRLVRVEVVMRLIELRDGRPTGVWHDSVEVSREVPR